MAVNSYLYFFMAPVIIEILIALCFLWTIVAAKPDPGGITPGTQAISYLIYFVLVSLSCRVDR